ncbi:hypothetical protein Tco_0468983 [Tanacetum coccineum]
MIVTTSMIELKSLFGHLFDEYFNGENQVVSKSFDVTTSDASDKRQQQPDSTSYTSTLATIVSVDGNFNLQFPVQCQTMVSLLVSKVDRLECAYTVYPILPAIPNQSRIIWEVGEILRRSKAFVTSQLAVEEVMSE